MPRPTKQFMVPMPDFNILRNELFSYGVSIGFLCSVTRIKRKVLLDWEQGNAVPDWKRLKKIEATMVIIRRAAKRAGIRKMKIKEFMYGNYEKRLVETAQKKFKGDKRAQEEFVRKHLAELAGGGTETKESERTVEKIWPGNERRDVLDPLRSRRKVRRFDWGKIEDSDREGSHQSKRVPAARAGVSA